MALIAYARQMKRAITSLVLLGLLMPIPQASAVVKPGATCTKLGATYKTLLYDYKCVKSGKKLVWSNDYARKPYAPSKTKTPIVAAIDPVLAEINAALDAQLPSVDLKTVDVNDIGKLIVEPGIGEGNVAPTLEMMKQLAIAQPIMKLNKAPVVILAHTAKFIKDEYPKYCNQGVDWIGQGEQTMENWNSWAGAGCLSDQPVQIIPMPKDDLAIAHIGSGLGSDMAYVPIGLNEKTRNLPTWFVRGLKGVVGEYVVSIGKPHWVNLKMYTTPCLKYALSDFNYSFEDTSRNHCDTPLGEGVSRYMVAKKGLKESLVFINELQTRGSWTVGDFEKFLGTDFATFEKAAKDYILRDERAR